MLEKSRGTTIARAVPAGYCPLDPGTQQGKNRLDARGGARGILHDLLVRLRLGIAARPVAMFAVHAKA